VTGQVPTREHCGERSAVGCVVMGGKGWAGLGLGGGRRGIVGGGVKGGGKDGGRVEVRWERKTGFCFWGIIF